MRLTTAKESIKSTQAHILAQIHACNNVFDTHLTRIENTTQVLIRLWEGEWLHVICNNFLWQHWRHSAVFFCACFTITSSQWLQNCIRLPRLKLAHKACLIVFSTPLIQSIRSFSNKQVFDIYKSVYHLFSVFTVFVQNQLKWTRFFRQIECKWQSS